MFHGSIGFRIDSKMYKQYQVGNFKFISVDSVIWGHLDPIVPYSSTLYHTVHIVPFDGI